MIVQNSNAYKILWHMEQTSSVLQKLKTDATSGLTESEAAARLAETGLNELEEKKGRSPFKIFISQFNDFMIWILVTAALISGIVLKEVTDAVVIFVILVINSVLGFVQEYRAEKALQALKDLAAPTALILRDGAEKHISSKLLVRGDIVRLVSGDLVPADCRIINGVNLQSNESILTGESLPVNKSADPVDRETLPLGDRLNMLFSGTTIVKGRCTAVVTETGRNTELGKIASLVQEKEEMTPLQKELKTVGTRIGIICLAVSAMVFVAGMLKGFLAISQGIISSTRADVISDMFLVAVALAVASIPEGLPAVVTISLALGVQKMAKNNAIVRRLSSVETLGSVSVICTDKTGTLTQNKMVVRKIYTGLEEYEEYERLLKASGDTENINSIRTSYEKPGLKFLIENAVLCNDAYYIDKHTSKISGDPTEAALIELGSFYSLDKNSLEFLLPRKFEEPFDSTRKMMTTVHKISEDYFFSDKRAGQKTEPAVKQPETTIPSYILFCKGAPEVIAKKCSRLIKDDSIVDFTEVEAKSVNEINSLLAGSAMRNLAFAFRYLDSVPDEKNITELEKDLVFTGMVGMIDPPRPEVFNAVAKCKESGINIIMVTGDHKLTAKAIGAELGILGENDRLVDEEEFSRMSNEDLIRDIEKIKVFARVSPEHKVNIVDALKQNDHIVAMTGDGINDAPSLKKADIGLAMGITGTDVSKEASDMILTDDNFATIVKAIKQGRVIYDNLKKFIFFLLSCNISEVLIMFIAILFGSFIFRL
ncbi:MAG: HAD-IC family P-type ATPase, partial [Actinobacteria bacterium]|nr:HAD-IC family P-type ATPase [Actinomycetota bacterium]